MFNLDVWIIAGAVAAMGLFGFAEQTIKGWLKRRRMERRLREARND